MDLKQAYQDNELPSIIDEADANTTYVGFALSGTTATSEAKFAIKKILISGTVTTITWAGGSKARTRIWDNRAALTYTWLT